MSIYGGDTLVRSFDPINTYLTVPYICSLVVGNVGSDTVQWIILEVCMIHNVIMIMMVMVMHHIIVIDGLN